MLATLMDISEAETGLMKLDRTEWKLADLVRTVREIFELVAEEKRIAVAVNVPEAIHCYADRGAPAAGAG